MCMTFNPKSTVLIHAVAIHVATPTDTALGSLHGLSHTHTHPQPHTQNI